MKKEIEFRDEEECICDGNPCNCSILKKSLIKEIDELDLE